MASTSLIHPFGYLALLTLSLNCPHVEPKSLQLQLHRISPCLLRADERDAHPSAFNICTQQLSLLTSLRSSLSIPRSLKGPNTDLEAMSQHSHQPAAPGLPASHSRTAWSTNALPERLWGTAERCLSALLLAASLTPP